MKPLNIKNNARIAAAKNAVAATWVTTALVLTARVMTVNKLSELSKPSAEVVSKFGDPEAFGERELKVLADIQKLAYGTKFYSQEYVSALLADRDAYQAIANEYQQLMYHMDAGGDFFEFQRDKNNG